MTSCAHLKQTSAIQRGPRLFLNFTYSRNDDYPIKTHKYDVAHSVIIFITVESYLHKSYTEFMQICFKNHHYSDPQQYDIKVFSEKLNLEVTLTENSFWTKLLLPPAFDLTFTIKFKPITDTFANFIDNMELTDFELKGEDGSVRISKLLLAAYSPVFSAMFSGEWKEKAVSYAEIKEFTSVTLQNLKNYIYKNVLPDSGLEELLLLASRYIITDLERNCMNKITENLEPNKAIETLRFASVHNLPLLIASVMDVVSGHQMRDFLLNRKS